VKHRQWTGKIQFSNEHEREAYEEYKSQIDTLEERLERMNLKLKEAAESPRYKEAASRLRAFKGIDYVIALALACGIGGFKRFANAKSFMSHLGFVPSENSSGGKRSRGGITKAGNGHLRKLLIEGAWHYAKSGQTGKRLQQRRLGCPIDVIDSADRAVYRLHKKYIRLLMKGKHANIAVTAVARELAGFVWAVQVSA
jgi:transposase